MARFIRIDENDCHVWTGTTEVRGRPVLMTGSMTNGTRRPRRVHRLVWEAMHGPIPEGIDIHHDCGNKMCVNPDHLRALAHGEHSALHTAALGARGQSERSRHAMHIRWHVDRGRVSEACSYCA